MAAPPEAQEDLLKELEEFAFQGIPDVSSVDCKLSKKALPPNEEIVSFNHYQRQYILHD